MISGSSWYSSAETHIYRAGQFNVIPGGLDRPTFLKVFKPAKIDPPIHVEYLRSGGA